MNQQKNREGFQGLLRIATSSKVRKNNLESSSSHWLYLITFAVHIASILQPVILNSTIIFTPFAILNKTKYLAYLVVGELVVILYLPFEMHNIEYTKALLYSHEFKGLISGFNIILFITFFTILSITVNSVMKNTANQYKRILSVFSLGIFIFIPLFGLFGAKIISTIFGMSNIDPLTPWFSSIFFFASTFCLVAHWIDSSVGDK